MATGNAGYAEGSKLAGFASKAGKITKFNPMIQGARSAVGSINEQQQPLNLGPTQEVIRQATPFLAPNMMEGYKQLQQEIRGTVSPRRGTGSSDMDGVENYPMTGGPIQFQQQPVYASDAYNYLRNYGINA
jgi:hypothetical protein